MTGIDRVRDLRERVDTVVARYPAWWPQAIVATWFAVISLLRVRALASSPPGFDGRLYRDATLVWLHGGDPWSVFNGPIQYAAPPPSLLAMVPFSVVSADVSVIAIIGLGLAGTAWAVHRLGLPYWWLLFPPFIDGLYNANPQVLLIPLIVAGAAPIAVLVKVYAGLVPLVRGEVRVVLLSAALLLVTAPFLPWGAYIAAFPSLTETLRIQADGGMSAWATPILLPVAAIALIAMGRPHAAWWIVPVLWPSTQWYYTSMVMPATTLLAAMVVAVPHPLAATAGAVVVALTVWSERKPGQRPVPTVLDGTTT